MIAITGYCWLAEACKFPPLLLQELQEDRVNEKVDVFSFGVVMWEIWTWAEQPYPGLGLPEIFSVSLLRTSLVPFDPSDCPGSLQGFPCLSDCCCELQGCYVSWIFALLLPLLAVACSSTSPAFAPPCHSPM